MKQPQLLKQIITSPTQALLELTLPAELFWFKGHFDHYPILPGVTQLTWAIEYAQRLLRIDHGQFKGIDVIKFQRPLLPNDRVKLSLTWLSDKRKLCFEYQRNQTIVSSGKINL